MGSLLASQNAPVHQRKNYRPLEVLRKEIRLLVVEAGSGDEPIRCSLKHVFLEQDQKPVYETVSYVWGDASIRANILLHDQDTNVPASSERVLRRMRHPGESRILWIDAICINQDDLQERSQQVGIMYEIYLCTARNLVWLGEDDGHTGDAINTMNALLEEMRLETNNFASFDDMLSPGDQNTLSQVGFSFDFDSNGLFHYLASPFFERLWIVQEVALAKESICFRGTFETPLEDVLKVAQWIGYKWLFVPETDFAPIVSPVMLIADWADHQHGFYLRSGPGQGRLLNLLESLREFKCQDPRDHVFGLLGLHRSFSPNAPLDLIPDYTASLADVLVRATRSTIEGRQDLACLHQTAHRTVGSLGDEVPTWVPRYDRAFQIGKEAVDFNLPHAHIMACGDRTQIVGSSKGNEDDEHILRASGFIVDTVDAVIDTLNESSGLDDIRQFFEQTRLLCRTTSSATQPFSEGETALILMGGATNGRVAIDEDDSLLLYIAYKDFLETNRSWPKYAIMSNPSPDGTSRDAIVFQESMKHACFKRRLFRTELGYIGLAPQALEAGDYLAILNGCRWPVALRKTEHSRDDCFLLGVCYVNRIMNGEAVESFEGQEGEDMTFRIR